MANHSTETGEGRVPSRGAWIGMAVFAAAAVCTVVWLMILGRGLTFFFDEWDFVNAAATAGFWHNVVQPHNGHPSMVPFSLYEVLFKTVGLRHYWPYQLLLVLLDVGCGVLLFLLLRRKVHPVAAAAAAAVLMLLGPAWQDLLWPFQIGFLGSVAGGLGALLFLDRESKLGDVGACACLVIAVGSSGVGLPFVAGVGVELLWRRRDWRRLWVPAVPLVLFVIWYETIGKSSTRTVSLTSMLHSMGDATATTVGALIGRGTTAGAVVAVTLGVLVVVAAVRSLKRAARLAMAATGLLTFWVLTLLARGVMQSSPSRYLYPAAAFVLVGAGELPTLITGRAPAHRSMKPKGWTRAVTTVVVIAIAAYAGLAIWWNSGTLADGSLGLSEASSQVGSELGAVVLAGPALPTSFRPDTTAMPQVTVGPFLRAVRAFGSPGDSRHTIETSQAPLTSVVDAMLLRARHMEVSADPRPLPSDRCEQRSVGEGSPSPTFTLSHQGVEVTAPAETGLEVRVRSFAQQYPDRPLATIAPGSTSTVRWSAKPSAINWQVELTPALSTAPPGSQATICSLSGGTVG